MQVVTVLKSGGRFDSRHVSCLFNGCRKWIRGYFDFVCLTDIDPIKLSRSIHPSVRGVPLVHNWPGWWSKMEAFRSDYNPKNLEQDIRTLYVDLDTVFCNYINPIFDMPHGLVLFGKDATSVNSSVFYKTSKMAEYAREFFDRVAIFLKENEINVSNYRHVGIPTIEDFLQEELKEIGIPFKMFSDVAPNAILSFPEDQEKIPSMEEVASIPTLSPGERCIVSFSRGKYPEDVERKGKLNWIDSNYFAFGGKTPFDHVWLEKK